jgi:hypothetical protein
MDMQTGDPPRNHRLGEVECEPWAGRNTGSALAEASEEVASSAAKQKPLIKKRAPHRSRITGLGNLPFETIETIP